MTTTLPRAASGLAGRIAGAVLTPADAGYHDLRRAWNRSYEHQPALIVVPSDVADVGVAVSHAAAHEMPVAIQATGHGVVQTADGAMLVLTRDLDEVTVDADAWTARIGAGAKWDRVLGPATDAGLAPLLGSTPDVSAVGYTLGGGMGWLSRKYGIAADHVRALEVVTADGRLRRCTPDEEPDLFWALRGGGAGSLGVVTAMEIDLVPVASVYGGNLLYPGAMAREVGARYREWVQDAPEALTSSFALMSFPPVEAVPEPIRGKSFAIVRGAFVGSDANGTELLRYWREWRAPAADLWQRMPFADVATISNDPLDPTAGLATTEWFDVLSDSVIDILVRALFEQDGPSPLTLAEVRHAGGAMAREPEHPNAYGNRGRQHLLEFVGITPTAEALEACEHFVAAVKHELAPHAAGGAYLNFLEGAEKVRRAREGFEPSAWERIRRIKAEVDPANLFSRGLPLA